MSQTQVEKARAEETNDKTSELIARYRPQLEALDDHLGDRALFPDKATNYNVELINSRKKDVPECEMMAFDGQTYLVTNPLHYHSIDSSQWRRRVRFFLRHEFASRYPMADGKTHIPKDLAPYKDLLLKGINMYIPVDSGRSFEWIQTSTNSLSESREMWEESKVHKDFSDRLTEVWRDNQQYKEINNIVCFGLGPIDVASENKPDDLERTSPWLNRYRVLLAFDIARMLKDDFQRDEVELIFHDTMDEWQYRELIQKVADDEGVKVSFLNTCEAILKVNGNTLVLAHGFPREGLPLRSIILDKTQKYGGPAGILCEDIPGIKTIEEEATITAREIAARELRSREKLRDPPTKRMAHQREKYGMEPMCRIDKWEVTMYLKSGGSSKRR